MTDWTPAKVLSNDGPPPHAFDVPTRGSSRCARRGLRVLSMPCSPVQSFATVPTSTARFPAPHARHRVWNFHPLRVCFGRVVTAPHAVVTVTPVASIVTVRSAATTTAPADVPAPDPTAVNWPEQAGMGVFLAVAGGATAAASIRDARSGVHTCMGSSLAQSARLSRAHRVPTDTHEGRCPEAPAATGAAWSVPGHDAWFFHAPTVLVHDPTCRRRTPRWALGTRRSL